MSCFIVIGYFEPTDTKQSYKLTKQGLALEKKLLEGGHIPTSTNTTGKRKAVETAATGKGGKKKATTEQEEMKEGEQAQLPQPPIETVIEPTETVEEQAQHAAVTAEQKKEVTGHERETYKDMICEVCIAQATANHSTVNAVIY